MSSPLQRQRAIRDFHEGRGTIRRSRGNSRQPSGESGTAIPAYRIFPVAASGESGAARLSRRKGGKTVLPIGDGVWDENA
jgi:hypothetical protein